MTGLLRVGATGMQPSSIIVEPLRLQILDTEGFDLQAVSAAANGLPAIDIDNHPVFADPWRDAGLSREERFARFAEFVAEDSELFAIGAQLPIIGIGAYGLALKRCKIQFAIEREQKLSGHNLACRCPLPASGVPDLCHARILLDYAIKAAVGRHTFGMTEAHEEFLFQCRWRAKRAKKERDRMLAVIGELEDKGAINGATADRLRDAVAARQGSELT